MSKKRTSRNRSAAAQPMREVSAERGAYRLLGFLAVLIAFGIVFVHLPAQIHGANASDFAFPLTALLKWLAPVGVAMVALLALPVLLLPVKPLRLWASLWFAAAVGIWVSGSLLVLRTGVLKGRRVELEIPSEFTLTSVVVLAGVVIGTLVLALKRPRPAVVSAIVMNVLLFAMTAGALLSSASSKVPEPEPAVERFYRFSRSRNVLVVLLDTLQSDFFRQLLDDDPGLLEKYDGFTFFPDTVGPAATTYVAMPAIHLGRPYDPETPLSQAYFDGVQNGSFLSALAKAGYESVYLNPLKIDCVQGGTCAQTESLLFGAGQATRRESEQLLNLSLFRVVPAPFKPLIYNGGAWRALDWNRSTAPDNRASRDVEVLRSLGKLAYASGEQPSAKFFHLNATHPPAELNEQCLPAGRPRELNRANMLVQARCAVTALANVLSSLKNAGVYDKTVIAVIADHGLAGMGSNYVSENERNLGDRWLNMAGVANPVMLFKPLNARGKLRTSDRPAEIADTAAMICAELGDCGGFPGTPVQKVDPGARARLFLEYEWVHEYWELERIPGIKSFMIQSPVWSAGSWSRVRRPPLAEGQTATFGAGSAGIAYLDMGWADPEASGVWSVGPRASISFSIDESLKRRPLRLRATLRAFIPEQRRGMDVTVQVGGNVAARWRIKAEKPAGEFYAVLPSAVWSQEDCGVTILLNIDSPSAPADFGVNPDARRLGIWLEGLRLEKM